MSDEVRKLDLTKGDLRLEGEAAARAFCESVRRSANWRLVGPLSLVSNSPESRAWVDRMLDGQCVDTALRPWPERWPPDS